MAILYLGIDLAKNVFALHRVDDAGKPALVRPSVPRAKLLEFVCWAMLSRGEGFSMPA